MLSERKVKLKVNWTFVVSYQIRILNFQMFNKLFWEYTVKAPEYQPENMNVSYTDKFRLARCGLWPCMLDEEQSRRSLEQNHEMPFS